MGFFGKTDSRTLFFSVKDRPARGGGGSRKGVPRALTEGLALGALTRKGPPAPFLGPSNGECPCSVVSPQPHFWGGLPG